MDDQHPKDMPPEQREAWHRNAESQVQRFRFDPPAPTSRPKQVVWLVKRPAMHVVVQCVRDGGENNLHYHTKSETAWMVLKGRARFVGIGETVLAELGPMEGIQIPGGTRYKFTKIGAEDLEILQMVAIDQRGDGEAERINLEAHRAWMASPELTKY